MSILYRKIKPEDNPYLAKIIRNVIEEFDAPRVGTVYSDSSTDYLFELFEEPNSILWVAEDKGKPVGCCGVFPTEGLKKNYCELVKFYISDTVRGKGLGKELMLKSIESAKEMKYDYIYLESLPHFSKAIEMYKKTGFNPVVKQLGNSGHSSCNVWMVKQIM